MTDTCIHAIIPCGEQIIFDIVGADDPYDEVYSIPYHHLAAVVSASPLTDYRGLQRNEAAHYLVAHQRIVEALMQDGSILPVKFGTVLPDEDAVRHLLTQGETFFQTALERFAQQVQLELIVLWNLQEVFQEIGQMEPIAQFKARLAARPPEETESERVAVGQLVKALLDRRRDALRDCLLPLLREVALDLVVNPLMNDSMVANVALLLDEAGREALEQRLEELDKTFEGRLTFRCVGPLPPYSFATVEVQAPSFEGVDEARRYLGLAETVNPAEIKVAYYRLAGRLHPDTNREDPEAETRMAELTQAYKLLA
ncbi:MAG: GvpL/GvpF family gas vesicle protein, partial [Chloroflexi bacterium]|nr:GvpL/GvpF family gas vesicle protein [Chloroflexota bacterium]